MAEPLVQVVGPTDNWVLELFRKGASMDRFFSRRELLRAIGAAWAALVGSRALGLAGDGSKPAPAQPVSATPVLEGPRYTSYDPPGATTRIIYPGTGTHTFVYDPYNRVTSWIYEKARPARHG